MSYIELTFTADAGRGYRLWIRGRADRDVWTNDSVFVQFAGSVTASAAPAYRIGTTDATIVNLEDASGAGLSGWGWQDNGWGAGVQGPLIYFAASGPQTIRVQAREDGIAIDQIVLSPATFLDRGTRYADERHDDLSGDRERDRDAAVRDPGPFSRDDDARGSGHVGDRNRPPRRADRRGGGRMANRT